MKHFISALYILLGLGMLAYGGILIWERNTVIPVQVASKPSQPQIVIPSAGIMLPVYPAQIYGTRWETTKLGVSHLSTSPEPGDIGNSVLYGHNWPNILGSLHKAKVGDKIYINATDGRVNRFTIAYVYVVNANQTEIFANTADHRITLYTCTALFDSKRLVITAILDPAPLSARNLH